jgi:putative DNA primase/helicase
VRLAIELHGESRFEPLDGGHEWRPMGSRLGWRTGEGDARQWLIPSETWKAEVCSGLDPKAVARALGERGMLAAAGDGWQPTRRIAGRVHRVYVVLATIFEGADHGD